MPRIDPQSLAQLKREVAKIPPQHGERAEKNRLQLLAWIERLEQTSRQLDIETYLERGDARR